MENEKDDYTEALILRIMCNSHKFYKKATEVTTLLKALTYKKDELAMLWIIFKPVSLHLGGKNSKLNGRRIDVINQFQRWKDT